VKGHNEFRNDYNSWGELESYATVLSGQPIGGLSIN
jgi:hypothetical protein